jgi:hypothetical protein
MVTILSLVDSPGLMAISGKGKVELFILHAKVFSPVSVAAPFLMICSGQ